MGAKLQGDYMTVSNIDGSFDDDGYTFVVSLCPKELQQGNVTDYMNDLQRMLAAYKENNFTNITGQPL